MKYLKTILILAIIFFAQCCFAQYITGGIEYNQTEAKNELFRIEPIRLNQNYLQTNIYDNNYSSNQSAFLNGITELKDRTLAKFSDGSYAVIYRDKPLCVLYYSEDGILTHTEIKTSLIYPYKSFKYNSNGKLIHRTLRVSEDETFIFDNGQNLIAHWVGENCYDENDNIIMQRKIYR